MNDVTALITAITGLCGTVPALWAVLTPRLERRREKKLASTLTVPVQRVSSVTPSERVLSRWAKKFADTRNQSSRRTTLAQSCALLACAGTIALVLLAQAGGGWQLGVAKWLVVVIGLLAFVGAGAGLEKAWTGWRQNWRLAITAAGGTLIALLAWVSALFVIAAS